MQKEPYSGKSDSDFKDEIERQHKQYKMSMARRVENIFVTKFAKC